MHLGVDTGIAAGAFLFSSRALRYVEIRYRSTHPTNGFLVIFWGPMIRSISPATTDTTPIQTVCPIHCPMPGTAVVA